MVNFDHSLVAAELTNKQQFCFMVWLPRTSPPGEILVYCSAYSQRSELP